MSILLNNRYRIIQILGSGGCGRTYLAEDTHIPSKRRCVVKQLTPATNDPVAHRIIKERFQREAAVLEMLAISSDQIPALHAYFTEDEEFYLVQEWIEGKNLTQKVKEGGVFAENQVRDILLSLLPVLDFIHSQGIIHRDIKPENVMLRNRDGNPVLIDFGAVKEVVTSVVDSQGSSTSSIVIGSPGFMSLEQAAGKPVFASDLYSLGLTAIYLITGKRPGELTDLLTGDISWSKHAANVSPDLEAVFNKAIRPFANERYRTAREMLEDLQPTEISVDSTIPAKHVRVKSSPQRPDIPTEKKPVNTPIEAAQPLTKDELAAPRPISTVTIGALLFFAALVAGGVSAKLRPYAEFGGVHYEAIVSFVSLVLLSLFLVRGRGPVCLKKWLGIYQIKTLCLWGGFIIGWSIAFDTTTGRSLAKFVTLLGVLWLGCALVGSLLCVGLYVWRKQPTHSTRT